MIPAPQEPWIIATMSGRQSGALAATVRFLTAAIEPVYAAVIRIRNWMFDRGHRRIFIAPRPVVSIGNLTTGGTGKTPIVIWIARQLQRAGHHPAVLLRGYKSVDGISDEALLLEQLITPSLVIAQPDRVAGATDALARDPSVNCFILDDGFQHRRLGRSLDIVLIDATEPFGFDHLLPRGLLREPVEGLRRCDAVIITRCEHASDEQMKSIEDRIRQYAASVPIFRGSMRIDHLLDEHGQRHAPTDADAGFAVCAIGNPRNFFKQVERECGTPAGEQPYDDHHAYTADDFANIEGAAVAANAKRIVTTEKDWVKLEPLHAEISCALPIWRAVLEVGFEDGEGERLLESIVAAIETGK